MRQEDLPKANANCVVCGKPYYRCERCIKLGRQGVMSWRLYCDTSSCYLIYSSIDAYKKGIDKKEDVRKFLSENNNIPNLTEEYQSILNEILFEKVEVKHEDDSIAVEEKPESVVVNKNNYTSKGKNQWKKSKQNVK